MTVATAVATEKETTGVAWESRTGRRHREEEVFMVIALIINFITLQFDDV